MKRKSSASKSKTKPPKKWKHKTVDNAKLFARGVALQKLLYESKCGLTLDELAKYLDVHPRTVNRYLAAMQKSGVELRANIDEDFHGLKRWSIFGKPLAPDTFDSDEVASLYLACKFLQPISGTFLGESADNVLLKIRRHLKPTDEEKLDKILKLFYVAQTGWADYRDKFALIETLMVGCEDSVELEVVYHSGTAAAPETYRFRPYQFIYRDGGLLVIGFSCKSNAVRTLKIERLQSVNKTKRKFTKPKNFSSDDHFASAVRYYSDPSLPAERVRFRVTDTRLARYLHENPWHKTQNIEEQDDGSVIVEITVQLTPDLPARLLGLGKWVEVLEPASLRKEVVSAIDAMRGNYS
ncbi:MAG: helix-turn-helix transcriptional regulator [Thermoguttaceae bacterium]